MKKLTLLILTGLLVSVLRCMNLTGGNGSETTNGFVVGRLLEENGNPPTETRVMLVAVDHDPVKDGRVPDSLIDTTDETGAFCLRARGGHSFNIEAFEESTGNRTIITGIQVAANDTGYIESRTIRKPGSIQLLLTSASNPEKEYVYLPGTTRFAVIRNENTIIDSIPAGYRASIVYNNLADPARVREIAADVTVSPDETVLVKDASVWKHSRKIRLNTTLSGADVTGTVTDFPVLIRLTADNFDFTQSRADGSDVIFTKEHGAPLPCEVERWDVASQAGEVWVRIDTVYGDDSTRSLMMFWGNSSAAGGSNGSAVFDTAGGFKGVWHMGENSGSINDATGNHHNGSSNGNQIRSAGVIGYGQSFRDSGDYTDMGNVCNPGTSGFSVCAWIKAVPFQKNRTIASKSSGGTASPLYGWLLELDKTGGLMVFIATGAGSWGGSGTFVLGSTIQITDSSKWHHVAAVFDRSDNDLCRLYIDGTDVSVLPAGGDAAAIGPIVNSAPLRLGADANGGCPWKGSMDECSISFRPRSADWIKLSYMNQKPDDRLLSFK